MGRRRRLRSSDDDDFERKQRKRESPLSEHLLHAAPIIHSRLWYNDDDSVCWSTIQSTLAFQY